MKQSLNPKIKVTHNPAIQLNMEIYGGNRYAIELNNTPFTVVFDDKNLDEFQPNKNS